MILSVPIFKHWAHCQTQTLRYSETYFEDFLHLPQKKLTIDTYSEDRIKHVCLTRYGVRPHSPNLHNTFSTELESL